MPVGRLDRAFHPVLASGPVGGSVERISAQQPKGDAKLKSKVQGKRERRLGRDSTPAGSLTPVIAAIPIDPRGNTGQSLMITELLRPFEGRAEVRVLDGEAVAIAEPAFLER